MEHSSWTIEELLARAQEALAVDYPGNPSGRVRDVPDLRTIRYYTTLGLLARPAEMRGRTALYGRQHLLQLVAIKRLQAQGLTLAQVQQALLGVSASDLEKVAQLPAPGARPAEKATERQTCESPRAFWKESPAAFVSGNSATEPAPAVAPVQGVPLAEDLMLLLYGARPLDDDDLRAIRTVAAPLLDLLHQRRLRGRAEKGPSHDQPAVDPV